MPELATTCQPGRSGSRSSSAAEVIAKLSRTRSSSAVSAVSPRSTSPANVDSVSASAVDRAAWLLRRAARSTTALTMAATAAKTPNASALFRSAIMNLPVGSVKNQLSSSEAATAAASAGQSPPTSATATTASRNSSTSLVRLSESRSSDNTTVSSGSRMTAAAAPYSRRRRVRPAASRGSRARPRAAWSWLTMCTSMDPDRAVTVTPMPGASSCARRPRREAPRTSWVAFSARAKVRRAVGMSSPRTWW